MRRERERVSALYYTLYFAFNLSTMSLNLLNGNKSIADLQSFVEQSDTPAAVRAWKELLRIVHDGQGLTMQLSQWIEADRERARRLVAVLYGIPYTGPCPVTRRARR